ncbi:MAG: hypothetical protein K2Q21_10255 [Chitinophagaceae bacterium]|nr:hypothetical protein [Chitinophagaceae bacterium]
MLKKLTRILAYSYLIGLSFSCNKESSVETGAEPDFGYTEYKILKGESYSVDSLKIVLMTGISNVKFNFKFDSSAIYTTVDPLNQSDINKLYGFADGVSFNTYYTIPPHHINSARFGWAWYNNALRIFGYCYNDSVRVSKQLQTVEIGKWYHAGIRLLNGGYEFTVENKKDTMARTVNTPTIIGYKLFPYFGGTETAPHDVTIKIRDVN